MILGPTAPAVGYVVPSLRDFLQPLRGIKFSARSTRSKGYGY